MAYGTRGDRGGGGGGGGLTENMLDDNVLGSVDNQENLEAPATDTQGGEGGERRRRRREHAAHHQVQKVSRKRYFINLCISLLFYATVTIPCLLNYAVAESAL